METATLDKIDIFTLAVELQANPMDSPAKKAKAIWDQCGQDLEPVMALAERIPECGDWPEAEALATQIIDEIRPALPAFWTTAAEEAARG